MADSLAPHQVRQALTARILTLSPSDGHSAGASGYAQASTDAWREAEEPLFPEWEPGTRAHLGFFVDDRALTDTGRSQSTIYDEPVVVAPIVVRFNARIRGGNKKKVDWDAAGKAGAHVLRHLLADGWSGDLTVHRDPQPLIRIPQPGDDFVVVEVRVQVLYQFSLAEPS